MELSQTAKLLYALLLDRSTLSQKNGWQDSMGRIYIVYPIAELAEMLDKSCSAIKNAMNELYTAGLLERKRAGFAAANHIYVKVPPVVQISAPVTARKLPIISTENEPYDSQKTGLMMDRKLATNKTTINNLTENQTMGERGKAPAAFGRYKNIFLSEAEYEELAAEYPGRLDRLIEEMSSYLAANGKIYLNYAAALHRWADRDKKESPKRDIPDYTFKEGESL